MNDIKHLMLSMVLLFPLSGKAENKILRIYQDADLSNHAESSNAIQMGIELAFDEVDNEIQGHRVEFKYLDHRGNVVRSKRNIQTYIDDPDALAIYSGSHSPPLIRNLEFINQNRVLTLVPWAAGSPITRYPSSENWIFRLSVDDSQAGAVIIEFALENQGCKSPHLLLEETPWGDSNKTSMMKVLSEEGIERVSTTRFGWNLKRSGARAILRDIASQGSDCIVLVANSVEGKIIIGEMIKLPVEKQLPVISHWGITGGDFPDVITKSDRENLVLHFIQPCFAFTNPSQSAFAQQVFSKLNEYTGGAINRPKHLKSAAGFIHAYDLTRVLIQAIRQNGLTGDMSVDRDAIRLALENIQVPVTGLIKTYISPFSVFDKDTNYDAHEALNLHDYCMGKYGPDNEIVVLGD